MMKLHEEGASEVTIRGKVRDFSNKQNVIAYAKEVFDRFNDTFAANLRSGPISKRFGKERINKSFHEARVQGTAPSIIRDKHTKLSQNKDILNDPDMPTERKQRALREIIETDNWIASELKGGAAATFDLEKHINLRKLVGKTSRGTPKPADIDPALERRGVIPPHLLEKVSQTEHHLDPIPKVDPRHGPTQELIEQLLGPDEFHPDRGNIETSKQMLLRILKEISEGDRPTRGGLGADDVPIFRKTGGKFIPQELAPGVSPDFASPSQLNRLEAALRNQIINRRRNQ